MAAYRAMSALLHAATTALLGGFVPVFIWLWFWLREDAEHPEPRKLIVLAFFAGMAAVTLSIPLEQLAEQYITSKMWQYSAWAFIEEAVKFAAALSTVLWRSEDDEPIDALIYMVIVALGFAAAENALFLSNPIAGTTLAALFQTVNLRFMGSTLLHVCASAIIGVALGATFYASRRIKIAAASIGFVIAGVIHTFFNLQIIAAQQSAFFVYLVLWAGIIVLFAVIEWIKRIHPRSTEKSIVQ